MSSFNLARGDVNISWTLGGGFSPSNPTISPGESATWWNADPHGFDVTITVSGFSPFTLYPGEGAGAPFPNAGTYSMQSDWGDSGTLTVAVAALPPSVSITNPVDGASVPANSPFDIEVEATAEAGMYSVEFYLETSDFSWYYIGTDYTPPFSATTNLTEGTYMIHAFASDLLFQSDQDTINITVVTAPATPVTLENPRSANGQFLFDIDGLAVGNTTVVQCCTNLSIGTWTSIATNTATSTTATVTNTATAEPRFYRVYQSP